MTHRPAPVIARSELGPKPWNLLVGAPETGGLVMVGMGTLPPATPGPPLHVHGSEDEGFVVSSGVLTARCGEQTVELHAGR